MVEMLAQPFKYAKNKTKNKNKQTNKNTPLNSKFTFIGLPRWFSGKESA